MGSQCLESFPRSGDLFGEEIPIWRVRQGWLSLANHCISFIHRGNNRQAVFFGEDDYQRFLLDLTQLGGKYRYQVHAYVLMTKHIHLLVTPGVDSRESGMM